MKGVSAQEIQSLLEAQDFSIVDREDLPARPPRFEPVPDRVDDRIRAALSKTYTRGLYAHQAAAVKAYLDGADVCLATSTASGKSLAFLIAAAQTCLHDPSAKVLALYPAKALIQDQLAKWNEMLRPLDLTYGFIDGTVPTSERSQILTSKNVVLMTPDVAHAWLMCRTAETEPAAFLAHLRLLILDEAHVYDGVFGTNMAFFLRRLECAAHSYQVITSTATIADEADFVYRLTGRQPIVFGGADDGSATPPKTLFLVEGTKFEGLVRLLDAVAQMPSHRFLAFADSRKMVERLVAAVRRSVAPDTSEDDAEDDHETDQSVPGSHRIFPYRAGYEAKDRNDIQRALGSGDLRGVVSTSALELGIDIGEIDLVVLLSVPLSAKAFKQRLGRAGRKNPAVCLIVDDRGILAGQPRGFAEYLAKPSEPNWLYMENRYLQYANALCAAVELTASGASPADQAPLASLPTMFLSLLENEIHPTKEVPDDLYPLKQRASAGAHREFPIRSDMEQNFKITSSQNRDMGEITHAQSLREAYPGAVYYYMAKPYRVTTYKYRDGEIVLRREKYLTTEPISQTTVFPRFGGSFVLLKSASGFVSESPLQVSERVLGFSELRGSARQQHNYGIGSQWAQKELSRFFKTTGVCWASSENPNCATLQVGMAVLEAFCQEYATQRRDLGVGTFYSQISPMGEGECRGVCIYDATNGSLRLTQRLVDGFATTVTSALNEAEARGEAATAEGLRRLLEVASSLVPSPLTTTDLVSEDEDGWRVVIARGERAMCGGGTGMREVTVLKYRYTPNGVMYDLKPLEPNVDRYSAPQRSVEPINGVTKLVRVNFLTEEEEPI